MRLLALSIILASACTVTHAQSIYRCTDAAGKVQLSDRMCDANAVDRARVVVRPNTIDASGEREQRLRQENLRLREQRMDAQGRAPVTGRTEADLQGDRSSSYECRQAQRDLRVASSSITPHRSTVKAAEHSMRAACGMREPTQVNVYNEAPVRRRAPISSTTGGVFTPAAGGWISPDGQFCASAAGGMTCNGHFVPVN